MNDAPAEARRRVFVLVLDDAGLGLESALTTRQAAKRFLSGTARSGDLVSVLVPEAGLTWWARLPQEEAQVASIVDSIQARRTLAPEVASSYEALQVVRGTDLGAQERARVRLDSSGQLLRASRFPGETEEAYQARNRELQQPYLQADSRRQLERDRERRHRLFASVSSALDSVATVKGRKSVLLFSEGFVREPGDPAFRDLVADLRRSNASIYFVDVQRLTSGSAADAREAGDRSIGTRISRPEEAEGAEVVAEETGGFRVHGSGALEAGLQRIAEESSSYYLLGYSPTRTDADGKYRRLHVEVRRPDLKVRARKGYYPPSPKAAATQAVASGAAADPELEAALLGAVPATAIPVRLTALAQRTIDPKRVRVRLVGEVGIKDLRFDEDPDGALVATLDVALAFQHVQASGRQRTPWREWKVKLPPQARGTDTFVPLEADFDLPGGAGQARLAVRDRGSRALGSVVHGFEVPDPASWRVSTPILTDTPGEERGRTPRARFGRTFAAGTALYCHLEVYEGDRKKQKKPAPASRVTVAYALVDSSGKTKKSQAASDLERGPTGAPTRLETIPLTGLSPGPYELRLVVRDESLGRIQELREPFTVTRPTRPDMDLYRELLQAFQAGEIERAASGVLEWRPKDIEALAATLPTADRALRRTALRLHTVLALRLWSHARGVEADAQVAIGRAVLASAPAPALHRDWLLELGYYHVGAASPAKALPFFEEASRLFPDDAMAWLGAGMCHEFTAFPGGFSFVALPSRDAAAQAERRYREAVRSEPGLVEARLRLGRVLGLTGAIAEAEKELSAAVEASREGPLTALARVFWGGLLDERGDLPGALRQYEAAVADDPGSQTAAFALSEALHRSGQDRRAAEALASALTRPHSSPISPWHAYHLGLDRQRAYRSEPDPSAWVATGQEP